MTRPRAHDLACVDAVELAGDHLEGALPAAEARRLEDHLDTCPGCAEYVAQMRVVAGSLGGLAGDSISDATRDRLLKLLRNP